MAREKVVFVGFSYMVRMFPDYDLRKYSLASMNKVLNSNLTG
jgi:hypothetical protein